jgi:hypothetical protein
MNGSHRLAHWYNSAASTLPVTYFERIRHIGRLRPPPVTAIDLLGATALAAVRFSVSRTFYGLRADYDQPHPSSAP